MSLPYLALCRSPAFSPSIIERGVRLFFFSVIICVGVGFTAPVRAAEGVTTQLSALKRVQSKDKTGKVTVSFVAFTKALPGDDVVYTVTCHNPGEAPASDVVITLPIPSELTFIPESVVGDADVTYSVDGGKTFDLLDHLVISAPDGASRPARVDDLNMISWKLRTSLSSASDAQVSFHAAVK